jgi:hypothetical protein
LVVFVDNYTVTCTRILANLHLLKFALYRSIKQIFAEALVIALEASEDRSVLPVFSGKADLSSDA